MLKLSQIWLIGLFKLAPTFFSYVLISFEQFLTFWHKTFQAHLVISLPRPRICYFSKKCFLLAKNGIQKPRSRRQLCLLLLGYHYFQALSAKRLGKRCMRARTCVYVDTHALFQLSTKRLRSNYTQNTHTSLPYLCISILIHHYSLAL